MNDEFFSSVYNASLDIISRREHSEQEITNKKGTDSRANLNFLFIFITSN